MLSKEMGWADLSRAVSRLSPVDNQQGTGWPGKLIPNCHPLYPEIIGFPTKLEGNEGG